MSIFNFSINLIESFFFSYYLGNYFSVEKKKYFILFTVTIQMFLLEYAIYIDNSGLWLTASILIFLISCLMIWTKKMTFDYFYIPILYNTLLVISVMISINLSNIILKILCIYNADINYILLCSFSKFIQVITTLFLIKKKINLSTSFSFKEWGSVIVLNYINLAILAIFVYEATLGKLTTFQDHFMLFAFFIMSIAYSYTFNQVDKLNQEKIKFIKNEELTKYNNEKEKMLKNLQSDIENMDHRLFYILYQIELALADKDYKKMEELLNGYRNIISKQKLACNTQNAVFDCLYSLKINELKVYGQDIDSAIFISKNDIYDNIDLISIITDLFEYFKDCKRIYVSINEHPEYVIVRFIYAEGFINASAVENYLIKNLVNEQKGKYDMTDHQSQGIRFSLRMEKFRYD